MNIPKPKPTVELEMKVLSCEGLDLVNNSKAATRRPFISVTRMPELEVYTSRLNTNGEDDGEGGALFRVPLDSSFFSDANSSLQLQLYTKRRIVGSSQLVIKATELVILVLALLENLHDEGVEGTAFTDNYDLEQQLKNHNKPFVKSFKMGDRDIFDCVDIYKQPALSHPLLKDHKIQMKPTSIPVMSDGRSAYKGKEEEFRSETKLGCPNGSVPIRRSSKQDLIKSKVVMKGFSERSRTGNSEGYHREMVSSINEAGYCGVYAHINLQNPQVEDAEQFSEAIMRLATQGSQINVIQAGWMVYEDLYGDNRTRLVMSWTDRYSGNWWLVLAKTYERIGYWPKAIFTGLQSCGQRVEWGGQVFSPSDKTIATPPMGSGHFAEEGFLKAATFDNLQYLNLQFDRIQTGWDQLEHHFMSHECYTLSKYEDHGIFYGGPGGHCPSTF
ncbi:NEP-interacting protein 1 [Senna tora]|uniref:NEP-interacting protein 1 n=1 Tax=Senna tora TaxID=362788 RepID=A0A834WQR9_9FABA|nr:NEP-interacting protein 1 [Senna tora]